jgi:hypothetical protein
MIKFQDADKSLVIIQGCRTIDLGKGYSTLIEEADYALLADGRWHATRWGRRKEHYATRSRRCHTEGMHRIILDAPDGLEVDHWNGDPLDNRRSNLRLASRVQNMRNIRPRNGREFKGITYDRRNTKRWKAQIMVLGKNKFLGNFLTKEEGARAYDRAAIEHFGEFARLNFPRECSVSA